MKKGKGEREKEKLLKNVSLRVKNSIFLQRSSGKKLWVLGGGRGGGGG